MPRGGRGWCSRRRLEHGRRGGTFRISRPAESKPRFSPRGDFYPGSAERLIRELDPRFQQPERTAARAGTTTVSTRPAHAGTDATGTTANSGAATGSGATACPARAGTTRTAVSTRTACSWRGAAARATTTCAATARAATARAAAFSAARGAGPLRWWRRWSTAAVFTIRALNVRRSRFFDACNKG